MASYTSLLLCVKVKFTVYVCVSGGCSAPGIYSGTQVDATRHFNPFLSGSPWEWVPYQTSGRKRAWGEENGGQNHSSIAPGLKVAQSTSNEENPTTQPHLKAGKCSLAKDPGREAAHGLCCRKVKKLGLKGDWKRWLWGLAVRHWWPPSARISSRALEVEVEWPNLGLSGQRRRQASHPVLSRNYQELSSLHASHLAAAGVGKLIQQNQAQSFFFLQKTSRVLRSLWRVPQSSPAWLSRAQ